MSEEDEYPQTFEVRKSEWYQQTGDLDVCFHHCYSSHVSSTNVERVKGLDGLKELRGVIDEYIAAHEEEEHE